MNDLCEKRRGRKRENKKEEEPKVREWMSNSIQITGESHSDLNQKKRKTDERE